MRRLWSLALGIALLGLAAPSDGHDHHSEQADHQNPRTDEGILALDVYSHGDGQVELILAKSLNEKPALFHQRSGDGGETWSDPVRVDHGMPAPYSPHRGMDPQIAANGQNIIAVWTTAGTDEWGSGPMATVLSDDGGKTWRPGPNPADDNSTAGHGFMDIVVDDRGAFHLTWLDSRDGSQGLRYSRSEDAGKSWTSNITVKAQTCECCPNTIAVLDNVSCILYRDRKPRDMRVCVSTDRGATWKSLPSIGNFDWQFQGCPHMGGGIAPVTATGELHVLVFTGESTHAGIWHSVSPDKGTTWSNVERVGKAGARHPDLAASADGRLYAVWDEYKDGNFAIWGSSKNAGEKKWSTPRMLSSSERSAMQPRVVRAGDGFLVLWTETVQGGPAILRMVKVK